MNIKCSRKVSKPKEPTRTCPHNEKFNLRYLQHKDHLWSYWNCHKLQRIQMVSSGIKKKLISRLSSQYQCLRSHQTFNFYKINRINKRPSRFSRIRDISSKCSHNTKNLYHLCSSSSRFSSNFHPSFPCNYSKLSSKSKLNRCRMIISRNQTTSTSLLRKKEI